jgi:hypothetical protein
MSKGNRLKPTELVNSIKAKAEAEGRSRLLFPTHL